MKTLEEMQEYADAVQTIEHYQKAYWARAIVLFGKALAHIAAGILFYTGLYIAYKIWGAE